MGKHIITNGFVENYTRWIFYGEAHRAGEEVVRQRIDDYDVEAGWDRLPMVVPIGSYHTPDMM